jgi:hypothetical protein
MPREVKGEPMAMPISVKFEALIAEPTPLPYGKFAGS